MNLTDILQPKKPDISISYFYHLYEVQNRVKPTYDDRNQNSGYLEGNDWEDTRGRLLGHRYSLL